MLAQSRRPRTTAAFTEEAALRFGAVALRYRPMQAQCLGCLEYRTIHAKGLCGGCYSRQWRKTHPGSDKRYRDTHLEACRERDRRYRADNRERRLEQTREWRANNRERVREYHREWARSLPDWRTQQIRNSDSYRKAHRRWRAKNREHVLAYNRHRRARKRGAQGSHAGKDIERLKQLQKNKCWWCGEVLNADYHVDHRFPLSRGGTDDPSNLVLTCPRCNLRKNAKLPSEFAGRLF